MLALIVSAIASLAMAAVLRHDVAYAFTPEVAVDLGRLSDLTPATIAAHGPHPFARVLDGLFALANRLFGVTVRAADGEASVWEPSVRFVSNDRSCVTRTVFRLWPGILTFGSKCACPMARKVRATCLPRDFRGGS